MSRMTVSTIVNHIITAHEQEGRTEFVLFAPMEMAALVESELNMLYSTLYATKAPNTTVAIGPLGGSESIYGTISMLVGDVESAKHLASLQSPLVLSVDEFTTKDLSLALVEMASQGLIRHYHLSGEVENPQHKKYDADIVGIDIETGGLNGYVTLESGERVHGALYYPILEVGIVLPLVDAHTGHCDVTNGKRLVVGLYPSEDVLERCHEWAVKQHTKSGLIDALRSGEGFDYVASTAQDMENYITEWLDLNGVRKFNSKRRPVRLPWVAMLALIWSLLALKCQSWRSCLVIEKWMSAPLTVLLALSGLICVCPCRPRSKITRRCRILPRRLMSLMLIPVRFLRAF